jgi:hypothetical protein
MIAVILLLILIMIPLGIAGLSGPRISGGGVED